MVGRGEDISFSTNAGALLQDVAKVVARDAFAQAGHDREDEAAESQGDALVLKHLCQIQQGGSGDQLLGGENDKAGSGLGDGGFEASQGNIGAQVNRVPALAAEKEREQQGAEGMFFGRRAANEDAARSDGMGCGGCERVQAAHSQGRGEVFLLRGDFPAMPGVANMGESPPHHLQTNDLGRIQGKGQGEDALCLGLVEVHTGANPGLSQLCQGVAGAEGGGEEAGAWRWLFFPCQGIDSLGL